MVNVDVKFLQESRISKYALENNDQTFTDSMISPTKWDVVINAIIIKTASKER